MSSGEGVTSSPSASVAPKASSRPEPPRSFNLKMAIAETKEEVRDIPRENDVDMGNHKVKAQNEFTATDVSAALDAYIGSLQVDTAVRIALTSHVPKVQGFVITLEIDNDILLAKTMDLHASLLSFLMKKLNNGFITLNAHVCVEVNEGQNEKRLFTAKDKFEHFMELNPAVGELKTLFGLEIE